MTELHLITAPRLYVHRPTLVRAMQFTAASRPSLDAWLAAELGRAHYDMTPSQLRIETTQGDSRDILLGAWVIERTTRKGIEFYPVEDEVVADSYDPYEAA